MSADFFDSVQRQESVEDAEYYLDHEGADINYRGINNSTALMVAASNLDVSMLTFLLNRNPPALVDLEDDSNKTALNYVYTTHSGHTEHQLLPAIKVLLAHRANPEHIDRRGVTILQWAATNGYTGIAGYLLEQHVYADDKLWEALFLARGREHVPMERLLAERLEDRVSSSDDAERPLTEILVRNG